MKKIIACTIHYAPPENFLADGAVGVSILVLEEGKPTLLRKGQIAPHGVFESTSLWRWAEGLFGPLGRFGTWVVLKEPLPLTEEEGWKEYREALPGEGWVEYTRQFDAELTRSEPREPWQREETLVPARKPGVEELRAAIQGGRLASFDLYWQGRQIFLAGVGQKGDIRVREYDGRGRWVDPEELLEKAEFFCERCFKWVPLAEACGGCGYSPLGATLSRTEIREEWVCPHCQHRQGYPPSGNYCPECRMRPHQPCWWIGESRVLGVDWHSHWLAGPEETKVWRVPVLVLGGARRVILPLYLEFPQRGPYRSREISWTDEDFVGLMETIQAGWGKWEDPLNLARLRVVPFDRERIEWPPRLEGDDGFLTPWSEQGLV